MAAHHGRIQMCLLIVLYGHCYNTSAFVVDCIDVYQAFIICLIVRHQLHLKTIDWIFGILETTLGSYQYPGSGSRLLWFLIYEF